MKNRNPMLMLALLMAATVGLLIYDAAQLPPVVATHFDGAGQPDGWMSRGAHLGWSAAICLILPFAPLLLFLAAFQLPEGWLRLPNRKYWLAENRRDETKRWMIGHILWMGCLLSATHLAVQALVTAAHASSPPRLAGSMVLVLVGGFMAAMATWVMVLWRRFGRLPRE